jgi:predicted membrane channel-forming protein YqfA (hemolysin III family)
MYDSVEKIAAPSIVAGMIMLLAEVLLILIARIKKLDFLLRGFFLFKLIGVLAFVVCLFLRMGNQDITGNVFYYIYSVWTVYLRPASRLLQLLFGVSEFFRKALLLSIITYLSGVAFFGVKKQKRFEKEIAENKNRGKETDSV